MTLYVAVMVVLVVLLVLVPVLLWAGRRARAGEVRADPHRIHHAASPRATADTGVAASGSGQSELEALRDYLLAKARVSLGIDLAGDALAKQRVTEAAVQAIELLRHREATEINLPFLTADASGPKHFQIELHRLEVEVLLGRRAR
jgi:hypothetical protein